MGQVVRGYSKTIPAIKRLVYLRNDIIYGIFVTEPKLSESPFIAAVHMNFRERSTPAVIHCRGGGTAGVEDTEEVETGTV